MIDKFNRDGHMIIRQFFKGNEIFSAREEIEQLGRSFTPDFSFENAAQFISEFSDEIRGTFYRGLRYLATPTQMACHPRLLALSKELGLMMPAVMHSYNVRMDMPKDKNFLFHWHQDSTYLLGSVNALTYWIPMVPASPETGTISLIAGSHLNGIHPYRYTGDIDISSSKSLSPKEIYLLNDPEETGVVVEAEPGDLVVFRQMLLHQSLPNPGNKVRWTIQVRHADLMEPDFRAAGYPLGDYTNIIKTNYLPGASKPIKES